MKLTVRGAKVALSVRQRWEGCAKKAAGDEWSYRLLDFFYSAVVLFFHAWNSNRKAYESAQWVCKCLNVERWSECVNSARGTWRLTSIESASVSNPEGRWESLKLKEWIRMRILFLFLTLKWKSERFTYVLIYATSFCLRWWQFWCKNNI